MATKRPIKVLIVDDSLVYRSQIRLVLGADANIEVVGTAATGKKALEFLASGVPVDLVTMDIEMPEMNGIEAIEKMRQQGFSQRVIVFSAQTLSSAEATIRALAAGADDFIVKPGGKVCSYESALEDIKAQLLPRIGQFSLESRPVENLSMVPPIVPDPVTLIEEGVRAGRVDPEIQRAKIVVIASSTGGPAALEEMMRRVPGPSEIPICLVQHMPPVFTKSLANRLNSLTNIQVKEAVHGEYLENNTMFLAPGDFHLSLVEDDRGVKIHLDQKEKRHSVRPCAEFLFESAAKLYGSGTFGIVMTGMGADGADGCSVIKDQGGCVVIQDRQSSVVWGMPGAVHARSAYDKILPLSGIGELLQLKVTLYAAKKAG